MLLKLSLLALLSGAVAKTESWHVVDIPAVICEHTDPDAPEYAVGINYTNDIVQDSPYILSFMRASDKQTTITFRVVDANNETVVDSQTVVLGELSESAGDGCACTGEEISSVVASEYGSTYGKSCFAWDTEKCDEWWGEESVGGWCCTRWCYSTPDCKDAYESGLMPGKYYSYKACPALAVAPVCTWAAEEVANDPCTCRSSTHLFNDVMNAKNFPDNYGSSCSAWDMPDCFENYGDKIDVWCCTDWCYVDKACVSAVGSYNEGMEDTLFFSYNVCIDDPAKVGQCQWKPILNLSNPDVNVSACECLDVQMPSDLLPSTAPANYGNSCAAHNKDNCDQWYPTANRDMWCCQSWCWVDESCPGSQEADGIWPGHFFSHVACEPDVDAILNCQYNETACDCTGSPGTAVLGAAFSDNYGANTCTAWDITDCYDKYGDTAQWDSNNDWCCDSWCYVDGACPLAKPSWVADGYFFSYDVCTSSSTPGIYDTSSDTCSAARLLEEELPEKKLRRLSARRRGGGGFSSSRSRYSSSSRSRSSTQPSSPRRRAPAPPPPPVRRRTPVPPTPQTELRRRTTSMNGNSYSSARRRAPAGDTSPRRRSSYDGNYGYSNKPQMMGNYGNTMPSQTSYGYSGYHAAPYHSSTNMMWYAGGGFVAGYALSSLMTPSYYYGGYGYHRYNRNQNGDTTNRRPSYCIVPEDMVSYQQHDQPGDFIDCEVCKLRYTFCLDSSSCQTDYGCGYLTQKAYNRDDLAATGFIPRDWKAPLSVIVESITGEDFDPDPMTNSVCPPVTAEQTQTWVDESRVQTIRMDLFVVLTQQDKLRTAGSCDTDTGNRCDSETDACYVTSATCNEQHLCVCPPGSCLNEARTACVDSANVAGTIRFAGSLMGSVGVVAFLLDWW